MRHTALVKKFRPIFVFSKGERYYPINKEFLKNNSSDKEDIKINDDIFKKTPYPQEPLYYHILDENNNMIAVAYILIFPYSAGGFFGLNGTKGDIVSCVSVIDKKSKTLKEIYFWNGGKEEYKLKTNRPVIFVSANDHRFLKELDSNLKGLRWEPSKVKDFKLKSMKNKKIEGKTFDYFMEVYDQ